MTRCTMKCREAYDIMSNVYDKDRQSNYFKIVESITKRAILENVNIEGKSVLDAGCGTGRNIDFFMDQKAEYIEAFDVSPKMIEKAEEYHIDNISKLYRGL